MRSGLWFTFLTNVVDESDVLNIFTVKIEQSHEVTELTASSLRISPIVLILSFFLSCVGGVINVHHTCLLFAYSH